MALPSSCGCFRPPHDGRAKDGSLSAGPTDWQQWVDWLAAGLHGRSRWRLSLILLGMVFARGRRTVTTLAAGRRHQRRLRDYYYFLASLGTQVQAGSRRLLRAAAGYVPLPERLLLAVDDSPTKRYGPQVEGAGIHHNPTPGPADQQFLYGHVWVTISLVLRHPLWGTIGLAAVGPAVCAGRRTSPRFPRSHGWKFRTKLELAAQPCCHWVATLAKAAGKTLWVVADGAYAKRPFLKPRCGRRA